MFYLTALNGPQAGKRYDLSAERYILGRHPECDIVVEVGAVSRQHAAITKEGSALYLEDLNSRNGTFVNNSPEKIAGRHLLQSGDEVRICDVTFAFEDTTSKAQQHRTPTLEFGENMPAAFMDDGDNPQSTVMSKLDLSSSARHLHVSVSPEVKLAAFVEITQNLGRALALDEVLPQVFKSLFRIFLQADRGYIVLKDKEGRLIPRWTHARRDDQQDTIRISRTIVNSVMESKQAILSADAASDARFEMSQSIADFRIRSMMCAPLVDVNGEAIGVLQIDTLDQRQRFQPDDLELLASTASQAAIAIQNAQLYEQNLKQKEAERDMQLAREVQRGFLPESRPAIAGYSFYDFYQPADQVGGDYYDYIQLPDERVAIVVADVVGHGVAAALLMAKLSAETRFSLFTEPDPATAVTRINERLVATGLSRFVTMIMLVIDAKRHKAVIVNAGHMAPLHRNGTKLCEPGDDIAGLPLGIVDSIPYQQTEIDISAGDILVLYTDGINETIDADGKFYGIDRMRKFVMEKVQPPPELGGSMVQDVLTFLGKAPQNDDMCLVCVGRM